MHEAFVQGSGGALAAGIGALVMAGVCIWWGIHGAGHERTFGDDKSTHEERKRRYGWSRPTRQDRHD